MPWQEIRDDYRLGVPLKRKAANDFRSHSPLLPFPARTDGSSSLERLRSGACSSSTASVPDDPRGRALLRVEHQAAAPVDRSEATASRTGQADQDCQGGSGAVGSEWEISGCRG